jgi:hypothetical protein
MADYFRKTDRGRREVRERSLQLSRSSRNLLLILDSSRALSDWTSMVQGASLTDGVALLEAGLIEAMPGPGGPETRPAAFEPTEPMGHDPWQSGGVRSGAGRSSRPAPLDGPMGAPVSAPVPFRDTPVSAPQPLRDGPDSDPMNTRWPPLPPAQTANLPTLRPSGLPPMPVSNPMPKPMPNPMATAAPPRSLPAAPIGPIAEPLSGQASAGGDSVFAPLEPEALGRSALGYTELYDSLNALLRETLGLFRGYRYTLRIERAQNVVELEAVAREFLAEVRRLRGDTMARMVQRALGFGG